MSQEERDWYVDGETPAAEGIVPGAEVVDEEAPPETDAAEGSTSGEAEASSVVAGETSPAGGSASSAEVDSVVAGETSAVERSTPMVGEYDDIPVDMSGDLGSIAGLMGDLTEESLPVSPETSPAEGPASSGAEADSPAGDETPSAEGQVSDVEQDSPVPPPPVVPSPQPAEQPLEGEDTMVLPIRFDVAKQDWNSADEGNILVANVGTADGGMETMRLKVTSVFSENAEIGNKLIVETATGRDDVELGRGEKGGTTLLFKNAGVKVLLSLKVEEGEE